MDKRPTALVLGGTEFLGIHLVERLTIEGWQVSLFNRGVTNPDLFTSLEHLVGDREDDVSALAGRSWDVIFDLSAFHPDHITQVARHLAGNHGHYVFVSTVSVYKDFLHPGTTENSPLATIDGPIPDDVDGETYGPLKALCEQRVTELHPSHAIVRPTIIAGPHDPSHRFTHWPLRLSEPGPHVVPPVLDSPVQYIDARDLADWLLRVGAEKIHGVYNTAADPLPFGEFLERTAEAVASSLRAVRLSQEEAVQEEVRPWVDLPLWLPPEDTAMRGFFQIDSSRARSTGLRTRPLEETARDTLAWAREQDGKDAPFGLSAEREAEIVATYGAHT